MQNVTNIRDGMKKNIGNKGCKCRLDSTVPVSFRCVDLYVRLPADTHTDPKSVQFVEHFIEDGRSPDWVVTTPP